MRMLQTIGFSALQRAEIAEIPIGIAWRRRGRRFSALQRAEIAEIVRCKRCATMRFGVSVLFNEPKLLKFIADLRHHAGTREFQCSSTSRNC